MSAAAFLRGTGNWTAYLNLGTPWLSAGWSVVTSPAAILASATAAGVGLYGLARRDMPWRRWLVVCVGVASAVALTGYCGPLGGPLSGPADELFNGALAPLRSLYKIEPVVAVALALGCAHAVSRWTRGDVPLRAGRVPISTAIAPLAALVVARARDPAAVRAGTAAGLVQPGSRLLGSGGRLPRRQLAASRRRWSCRPIRTASTCGATRSTSRWSRWPRSPWAERGLVPYGGAGLAGLPGHRRAGRRVRPGGSRACPIYLDRAGIRYVVVRNDLDPATIGYVSPQIVNQTLALSGFERVASFGPAIPSSLSYLQTQPLTPGPTPRYPAVEIFQAVNPGWRPVEPGDRPPGEPNRAGQRRARLVPAAGRAGRRHHRSPR